MLFLTNIFLLKIYSCGLRFIRCRTTPNEVFLISGLAKVIETTLVTASILLLAVVALQDVATRTVSNRLVIVLAIAGASLRSLDGSLPAATGFTHLTGRLTGPRGRSRRPWRRIAPIRRA